MLEERMTAESNKLAAEGPKFLAEAAKEVYNSIVKTLLMHAATCMGTHCVMYKSIAKFLLKLHMYKAICRVYTLSIHCCRHNMNSMLMQTVLGMLFRELGTVLCMCIITMHAHCTVLQCTKAW